MTTKKEKLLKIKRATGEVQYLTEDEYKKLWECGEKYYRQYDGEWLN